jgi:membrane protease YdiL (CAAX protease family)
VKTFLTKHPVVAVLSIWVGELLFLLFGGALLSLLFPTMPGYSRGLSRSMVLLFIGVLLVAALLTVLGLWRRAGFVGPSRWRNLRLLVLPALLLFLPFLGGVRPAPTAELLTLIVGYVANGFFEEGMYRGIILGLIRPTGTWRAVLISSLLFGLTHLTNIALRGNPSLIALQALGAGVQGIGLAALRLSTGTIWTVIVWHAIYDLFLQLGGLPIPLADAASSIILMVYGVYLLRPSARVRMAAEPAEQAPTVETAVGVAVQ